MFTLKIPNEQCRDNLTIQKAVENIIKWRTRSGGRLIPRDEHRLKRVIAKQLLTDL